MKKPIAIITALFLLGIGVANAQYTDLINFTGTTGLDTGAHPYGSLTSSITGDTLYGMTSAGGTLGWGNIFLYNPTGNIYTNLINIADDNQFSQNGVKVLFSEGKIIIKGKTYDVNSVTGISIVRKGGIYSPIRNSFVFIKVDDFGKPIHRIVSYGGGGEKFLQRLEMALRKAGGRSFS